MVLLSADRHTLQRMSHVMAAFCGSAASSLLAACRAVGTIKNKGFIKKNCVQKNKELTVLTLNSQCYT